MNLVNIRLLKQAVEEKRKPTYPDDHEPLMRVPKGGSSCSNCEYVDVEAHSCKNDHYVKWNGGDPKLLDVPLDSQCSDWWEGDVG